MQTISKTVVWLLVMLMTSPVWAETPEAPSLEAAGGVQFETPEDEGSDDLPAVKQQPCPPQRVDIAGQSHGEPPVEMHDEQLPMYVSTRAAVVVPAKASEDSHAFGTGFGLVADDGSFFGLRVVWLPDPPSSSLSGDTPDVDTAWGPLLEWQNVFSPAKRLSFFSNLSAGFVYGTPADPSPDTEAEGEAERNVILPLLELGVGM